MANIMNDVTKDVKLVVAHTKTISELQREVSNTIQCSRIEGIGNLSRDFGDNIIKVEVSDIDDCKFKMRVTYKELSNDNLRTLVNKYRTDKLYAKDGHIITESESKD